MHPKYYNGSGEDLKTAAFKYNASMLVSHISKYIATDIGRVKLDENNNVIPQNGAKLIDLNTAKSPYIKRVTETHKE